jgi:hypothetical protein
MFGFWEICLNADIFHHCIEMGAGWTLCSADGHCPSTSNEKGPLL